MISMFPFSLIAVGVAAAACFVFKAGLDALSDRERKRQDRIKRDYEDYKRNSENINRQIRSEYSRRIHSMDQDARASLNRFFAEEREYRKTQNKPHYDSMLLNLEEQRTDTETFIRLCKEVQAAINEHENSQKTALRNETIREYSYEIFKIIVEKYAYLSYLGKYETSLKKQYARSGNVLGPFSMTLPENMPYMGKLLKFDEDDLKNGIFEYEVTPGVNYEIHCEDYDKIGNYDGYALVERKEGYQFYVSVIKGHLRRVFDSTQHLYVKARVVKYQPVTDNIKAPFYVLEYEGLQMRLYKWGMSRTRKLVKGQEMDVYIVQYNNILNMVVVSENYTDSLHVQQFTDLPLRVPSALILEFKKKVEDCNAGLSHDFWYIGPTKEDKFQFQLGSLLGFICHVRQDPKTGKINGFVLERLIDDKEMFRFNDIFLAIDADLHAISEKTPDTARDGYLEDLFLYLGKEFERQKRIKSTSGNGLYINQWAEITGRLVLYKKYGCDYTTVHIAELLSDNP